MTTFESFILELSRSRRCFATPRLTVFSFVRLPNAPASFPPWPASITTTKSFPDAEIQFKGRMKNSGIINLTMCGNDIVVRVRITLLKYVQS